MTQLGYTHLKDLQLKVVTSFVAGEVVFAILLTEYGKSLMPALLYHIHQLQESIVIVVTPLSAVLEDQTFSFCISNTPYVIFQPNLGSSMGIKSLFITLKL